MKDAVTHPTAKAAFEIAVIIHGVFGLQGKPFAQQIFFARGGEH